MGVVGNLGLTALASVDWAAAGFDGARFSSLLVDVSWQRYMPHFKSAGLREIV